MSKMCNSRLNRQNKFNNKCNIANIANLQNLRKAPMGKWLYTENYTKS